MDNRHYKIVLFPVYIKNERYRSFSEKFDETMLSALKSLPNFTVVSFGEIKRLFPELTDSNGYNNRIRRTIASKLLIDWIITTKISFQGSQFVLEYRLINAKTKSHSQSNITGSQLKSVLKTGIRRIKELREFIASNNAFTARTMPLHRIPIIPDDGRKKWSVCIFPVETINFQDNRIENDLNNRLINDFKRILYLKLITINDLKALAPSVKNSKDYTSDLRRRIFTELKADFIVLVKIKKDNSRYNASIATIIAHSGKMSVYTIDTNVTEYISRNITDKFVQFRKKIYSQSISRITQKYILEWDKELGNIQRSAQFQYPKNHESGSMHEFPARTETYPYYLHLPPNYQLTGYSYPLLVYLHGARQRSDTLSPVMLATSPLSAIYRVIRGRHSYDKNALRLVNKYIKGSIVLIPQVPERNQESWDAIKIHKLVINIIKKYPVNLKRVYVMGISLGGTGTWRYGNLLSSRLAALVPICGANPFIPDVLSPFYNISNLNNTPIWAFHAFNDDVLSYWHTVAAFEYFLPGKFIPSDNNIMENYPHTNNNENLPANDNYTIGYYRGGLGPWERGVVYPKGLSTFTLYRSGKHDAWTPTYSNDNFWKWLYSQQR